MPVTIPANQFTNDTGTPVEGFAGLGPDSYYNLYINGILQPGYLYSVNPAALDLSAQDSTIYAGTPFVLEIVQVTANVILSSNF
ncbi:hypothetical protein J22TS3_30850 [Paenibacillus sp. J22TS3]|nr:hypothetical protein J22TS3_30850 [Paenibacillus sp. J22TS3]